MLAIDDGIWQGNYNAADILFIIAAFVFAVAAVLPHTRRAEGARLDVGLSLVSAGLCLLSVAWLVL